MENTDIQLGDRVKDRIDDDQGIVTALCEYLSGYRRVILGGNARSFRLRNADAHDCENLTVISSGEVEPVPLKIESPIKLGDEVRDKVTGLVGIAYIRMVSISGCLTFFVQPPAREGKIPEMHAIDAAHLVIVKENAIEEKPVEQRTGPTLPGIAIR